MKFNQYSPDFIDKPIRLLEQEIANPLLVFREVFEFYDLNHIRVQLADWLELAFSSNDDDLKESIPRVNLMQFALHLEAMAEAAFLLHKRDSSNDVLHARDLARADHPDDQLDPDNAMSNERQA